MVRRALRPAGRHTTTMCPLAFLFQLWKAQLVKALPRSGGSSAEGADGDNLRLALGILALLLELRRDRVLHQIGARRLAVEGTLGVDPTPLGVGGSAAAAATAAALAAALALAAAALAAAAAAALALALAAALTDDAATALAGAASPVPGLDAVRTRLH